MINSLRSGNLSPTTLIIPGVLGIGTLLLGSLGYAKIAFKGIKKRALSDGSALVDLGSDYKKNLWKKMEHKITENIEKLSPKDLWAGYGRSYSRIEFFLNNDDQAHHGQ